MLKGIIVSVEDALTDPEENLLGILADACARAGGDWQNAREEAAHELHDPAGGIAAALAAAAKHAEVPRAALDAAFFALGEAKAAARRLVMSPDWEETVAAARAEQIAVAFVSCFRIAGNPFANEALDLDSPAFGHAPPGASPQDLSATLNDLVGRLNLQPSEALLAADRTDLVEAAGKLPCRVFSSRSDLPAKAVRDGSLVEYAGKPDVAAFVYAFLDESGQ